MENKKEYTARAFVVKGKTEENPRDTQEGFFALGGAAVLFAATFAVESIFK